MNKKKKDDSPENLVSEGDEDNAPVNQEEDGACCQTAVLRTGARPRLSFAKQCDELELVASKLRYT